MAKIFLRWDRSNDCLFLDVTVNGIELQLLVDSGAPFTAISVQQVELLSLKSKFKKISKFEGSFVSMIGTVGRCSLKCKNGFTFRPHVTVFQHLDNVCGVLGTDVLFSQRCFIDTDHENPFLFVRNTRASPIPRVTEFAKCLIGNRYVPIILDTGCSNVYLPKKLAESLKLDIQPFKKPVYASSFSGKIQYYGHVPNHRIVVGSTSTVVDILVHDNPTAQHFTSGLIGMSALKTLKRLYFSPGHGLAEETNDVTFVKERQQKGIDKICSVYFKEEEAAPEKPSIALRWKENEVMKDSKRKLGMTDEEVKDEGSSSKKQRVD